ncbi:MAG: hypothetical protein RMY64_35645 [Nostoc sp. DedQUE08]|uniref:hypothetical protein n=1 Tax=Nostoc sp. DedQUE08 TaxID=3075393 RepID=UPI002AD3FDA6|nr:hypothetical protein [Nostoc sp. DedQUE08]MDZ8070893.1 hypothetical protein [Nostoc sp. DedQUE08]
MPRPKNIFVNLGLNEQENIVQLTVRTSSAELALKVYNSLEFWLIEAKRDDLELDWEIDNNPDANQE